MGTHFSRATFFNGRVSVMILAKNSTSREFTYIRQTERVKIVAVKFYKTRCHFLIDVFLAVDVVLS